MSTDKMFANIEDVKSVNKEDRMIEFTATKEIRDYDGDILKIEGLDISKIKKNKSFLWSHQMHMPPIGKITKIWKDGKTVKGQAQMTSADEYFFGYTIYTLIDKGYINNVSISFIPNYETMEYKEGKEGERTRIINDSTLLEVSAVNVGANNSTTLEAKAFKDIANKAWEEGAIGGQELKAVEDMLENYEEEPSDNDNKIWIYDEKDWLYLAHHMHENPKNLLNMEELHHCDLFTEKDMKGEVYIQKHVKNGKKLLHAIDTDDIKSVPKSLHGHLGNEFKISKKTIDDKKYAILTNIIDNKSYKALEIKIAELELQLMENDFEELDKDSYINQLYDEYVGADGGQKDQHTSDHTDNTLCIDDLDKIL